MVHFEEPQSDIKRHHLTRELDELLEPGRCKDYCPNGLVLEGRAEIGTLVTGVTASLALRHATVEARADALFVHHGWFWRDEEGRITGARRERIANGLVNDLNLYAFHLPLDVHSELGDNAQIGRRLGLLEEGGSGEQDLVCHGRLASSVTLAEFTQRTQAAPGRAPLVIGDAARRIERVAWCTGAAQGFFEQAVALGVDAYVTGEISEQHAHLGRESGVAFIAAGHHATGRFGAQALGAHLAERFGLAHRYIEADNPV